MDHYGAVGTPDALAYVMALMHWRGCSIPGFLLRRPLHPPTGLVRWLSSFSVIDQVDNGQLLLEQLVLEEARIFAHSLAIVRTMQRMKSARSPPVVVLLPELLSAPGASEASKMTRGGNITTFARRKFKDLALPRP
jgi:hypothetical protein